MEERVRQWLTDKERELLHISKANRRSRVDSSDWLREQQYLEELRVIEWIRDRLNI